MEKGDRICQLFDNNSISYKRCSHSPTRTSEESHQARMEVTGESVMGAKALVILLTFKNKEKPAAVLVLPSSKKIDAKKLKQKITNLKSFRFATPEEMASLTGGLVPGSMPPFARPIFEELQDLFIDSSLLEYERIGFNIGSLTESVILSCEDYLKVVNHSSIFDFSN